MLRDLLKVAKENFDHFSANESAAGLRFRAIFQEIVEVVTKDEPVVEQIKTFAPLYDFDESSPGNGYRGFVFVYDAAVAKTLQLSLDIQTKRESFFFRSKFYQNETAAFVGVLRNLSIVASGLLVSHSKAKGSCLLNEEGVDDIEKTVESVELEVFYGRALLFHFPESLRGAGHGFAALTSAYSELYFTKERTFMRMLRFPYNFLKYFTCKETLAKRLVEINENVQIDFTKASMEFFNSKVATFVTSFKGPRLPINKTFKTAATAQLVFSETQAKTIEVPVPSSFIGPGPVSCRLMSATRRKGMIGLKPRQNAADMSKSLVVHVHGGGWCTQNSKIHGPYLRKWAAELDVPILSIDYNLAPEAPFPRPVDEVFFAYCWALNNLDSLGSTGENVIFVADASGCSIITACLIKCIEMGVRKPKALLTIYGAFALNYYMAPSRLLSVFESVVPYQLLTSYVGAYAGAFKPDEESNTPNRQVPKKSEKRVVPVIPKDYLMSPYLAPKEILNKFPKTHVLSTNLDCCLDESVEFAKRLRDAGADVKCEVYEGLNHGFLNFAHVSEDCFKAAVDCAKLIAELLELEWFNRP